MSADEIPRPPWPLLLVVSAVVAVAWSLLIPQVATVKWTPDCGGMAYGFPFAYVQQWEGSSMTFLWSPLPFAGTVLAHALALTPAAWLLTTRLWTGRRKLVVPILAFLPLPPAAGLLLLPLSLGLYLPTPQPPTPFLGQWVGADVHLGPPRWESNGCG